MNIQAQGLRTTIYKVDDLQIAKKWYASAFGTDPYFDEPFYVGFNIAGFELGLIEEIIDFPRTTNVLTYWAVEDITDSFDIMCTNGAKELEKPNDVGGDIKVALVKDPWENVIGLIYNPHFREQLPKETVVEWAGFDLIASCTEVLLLEVAARMDREFFFTQKGFIKRELLKKSASGWVDLIYWTSEQHARAALEKAPHYEVVQAYFQLMSPKNSAPPQRYFQVVKY